MRECTTQHIADLLNDHFCAITIAKPITQKLWDYIKANQLQTKTPNGKPENAGKFIVADQTLLPIFKKTKFKSKSGKVTDLTKMKLGETVDMMQMAAIVSANIET